MGGTSPAHDARQILAALQGVVLGQEAAIRETLICLLARGHVLLEGVPGTAKTLLVRTMALALKPSLRFILSWETDGNDVDLHVRDRNGQHAFFSAREMPIRLKRSGREPSWARL